MKVMAEYDEKTILDRETFEELYSIDDEYDRADRLIALTERAYDFSKKCGDTFKTKATAFKKQFEKEQKKKKSSLQMQQTDFRYFEDGHELNCGGWIADRNGVLQYNRDGLAHLACYHPILISQILKNAETKKYKVKLAYQLAGEWDEIIIDRKLISSASKIVDALSDYGIDATSENAKYLVKYLSDLENMNVGIIERKVSTSKFGWFRDDFVPYGMDVEFDAIGNFRELFDSVKEKGSPEKWLECVKEIRAKGRKEPLLYLAGSFASILLSRLDLLSFVLNLWEKTGKGKTVSMMVASSIWGDPRIGKFTTDVSATGTGFEVRSDVLNHLPLLIDDLSKVKESYKDMFSDLVYEWCSGKGKDRSDQNLGLRKTCTWNNVTMTCYERPLATEYMRGGSVNRILDFQIEPGAIFSKEEGNKTVSIVTKNYGFAGKWFVRLVKEIGIDKIRELQRDFLKKIDTFCKETGEEKSDKQKLPMSVLLAADKLATDYIFKDGVYLDFEWCVRQLKSDEDVSEDQRAYNSIMDDVAIHINNFKPDDRGNYKGEFWGGIKNGYVYIVPTVFNQMAERYNFSPVSFLKWADVGGLLLYDKGKKQKTERIPAGEKVRKFYAIKIREDEPEKEKPPEPDSKDEFMPIDDQMELPFT